MKSFCTECHKETNFSILKEFVDRWNLEDAPVSGIDSFQVIQCLGCDNISFRRVSTCSEYINPEDGSPEEEISLYPGYKETRDPIDGFRLFPMQAKEVYVEVLDSINNKDFLLAAVGLRMLIESVCIDIAIKGRTLKEKIDSIAVSGYISTKQADFLHKHRFMGNMAAHEIKRPNEDHLIAALEIAETLLKAIYILPKMAQQMEG